MGYSIGIGNLLSYKEEIEDGIYEDFYNVEKVKSYDAPNLGFGDISGYSNFRHPSYSGMNNFINDTKSGELFNKFFNSHPGYLKITKNDLVLLNNIISNYESNKLGSLNVPSKCKEPEGFMDKDYFEQREIEENMNFDWNYAKLQWYKYWFEYALENYENPVMLNR